MSNAIDITAAPYSVDPTGANDCTAALEDAVADLPDGGLIHFPAGLYKLAPATFQHFISLPADLTYPLIFDGYGSTIKLSSTCAGFLGFNAVPEVDDASYQNIKIKGFDIDGAQSQNDFSTASLILGNSQRRMDQNSAGATRFDSISAGSIRLNKVGHGLSVEIGDWVLLSKPTGYAPATVLAGYIGTEPHVVSVLGYWPVTAVSTDYIEVGYYDTVTVVDSNPVDVGVVGDMPNRASYRHISVRDVHVYNAYARTMRAGTETNKAAKAGIRLNLQQYSSSLYSYIEDIEVKNVRLDGCTAGVNLTGNCHYGGGDYPFTSCKNYVDDIRIDDLEHNPYPDIDDDEMADYAAAASGAYNESISPGMTLHVGSIAHVGRVEAKSVYSKNSRDGGLEFNSAQELVVRDAVVEDSLGSYVSCNAWTSVTDPEAMVNLFSKVHCRQTYKSQYGGPVGFVIGARTNTSAAMPDLGTFIFENCAQKLDDSNSNSWEPGGKSAATDRCIGQAIRIGDQTYSPAVRAVKVRNFKFYRNRLAVSHDIDVPMFGFYMWGRDGATAAHPCYVEIDGVNVQVTGVPGTYQPKFIGIDLGYSDGSSVSRGFCLSFIRDLNISFTQSSSSAGNFIGVRYNGGKQYGRLGGIRFSTYNDSGADTVPVWVRRSDANYGCAIQGQGIFIDDIIYSTPSQLVKVDNDDATNMALVHVKGGTSASTPTRKAVAGEYVAKRAPSAGSGQAIGWVCTNAGTPTWTSVTED